MSDTKTCACHANAYNPCDYPGGCGSRGACCSDTTPGGCSTCPVYRPDTKPRLPHRPPVCDGDRVLLDKHLLEVANLVAVLSNDEPPIVDGRQYRRFVIRNSQPVDLGDAWADPVAALGGVAPINSRSSAPSVSGSRERPIPIPVAELDLKTKLRPAWQAYPFRGDPDDQVGQSPAAVILAEWVRDIRDTLFAGHHLPRPGVDDLVMWLRNRLERICDEHPAVADFATEMRNLRSALRSAAGETEPQPQACEGVACRRCDLTTLYRQPGGDVTCINPDCQAVLRLDEYGDWVKTLAAELAIRRHAGVRDS